MKLIVSAILFLALATLSACAGKTIFRDCKMIGQDTDGKTLFDSCERVR